MILIKIKNVFVRTIKEVRLFPKYLSEFGFITSLYIIYDHIFLRPKSKRYIKAIYKYNEKFLFPIIQKYNQNGYDKNSVSQVKVKLNKIPVWVCWLQGEDNMPELVKMCYDQLHKVIPNDIAEIHLLTFENMNLYIDIDNELIDRVRAGTIKYALFSDVIRYKLLKLYGGLWIDSTIFVSEKINKEWFEADYFTMKMHKEICLHEACEGKWTNFCFSGKRNSIIFTYMCDALDFYIKKHNILCDYVLVDYLLMVGYNNIPQIRELIDNVPYNNEYVWALKDELNKKFDEKLYNNIVAENIFHKLAHQVSCMEYDKNDNLTFYGYLLNKNNAFNKEN